MGKKENKKEISSLSISGRIILDMHSLNNEGGEGNQILTRQVTIIDKEGKPAPVNAVSGDMLKHIQAQHLYNVAIETGLNLCSSCKVFNANRITDDAQFTKSFKKTDPDEEVMDKLLKTCAIDDMEGILVTNNNKNLPRKSVAEFGWLIALPEASKTENFFHVKLVPNAGKGTGEGEEMANIGQNIFHRPANSGIYALVSNFDTCRIGYNDISKTYAIGDNERISRYQALLKSILYTFLKPTGAMRNTQNPHIVNFEGVISYSSNSIPAPTVSALNKDYDEEILEIAENLNKIADNSVTVEKFKSLKEFTEKFQEIINNTEPLKLKENEKKENEKEE
ncbi:MAG: DevR family CRISPR-associated autoregulator [Caldisericota bacterium]|nr:DevR family CRISPR-associated autoregulator [Caldisericota bacterium]